MSEANRERLTEAPITAARLELGDQAEELLTASSVPEMVEAAKNLRLTALRVRRMLMDPSASDTFLQMNPSVTNPEQRRVELADLAVHVVTAVDYLLRLLLAPTVSAPPFTLAREVDFDCAHGSPDEKVRDRMIRRRLDARGSAVRLGMRLLADLRSDVANT